jgi:hypothetical protein
MNRHPDAARLFLCLAGQFHPFSTAKLLSVPFLQCSAGTAGPAALAMILSFYGTRASVRRIADEVGMGSLGGGSVPQMLADAAQGYGFNARVACGDIDQLAQWLDRGIPPLVFSARAGQDAGEPVALVTGISPLCDAIRVHRGSAPHQWLQAEEFKELCGGDSFTALVVSTKIRPTWEKVRTHDRPFWSGFPASISAVGATHAVAA